MSSGLGSFCRLTKVASTSRSARQLPQRHRSVDDRSCGPDCRTRPGRRATCREVRGGLPRLARGLWREAANRMTGGGMVSRRVPKASGRLAIGQCRSNAGRDSAGIGRHCETPGNPDSSGYSAALDHQNDAGAARGHHRHIARELNGIAQSFIDMDEDGLAFDGFLAKPHRLAKFRVGSRTGFRPARLAPGPAGLEIAGQHLQQGQIPVGRRRCSGCDGLDVVVERESLIEALQLTER